MILYTFIPVPMNECFSPVHGGELLQDSVEGFLDCSRVCYEGPRILHSPMKYSHQFFYLLGYLGVMSHIIIIIIIITSEECHTRPS